MKRTTGLIILTLALAVAATPPAAGQGEGSPAVTGGCVNRQNNVIICWDDLTEEQCENVGGDVWSPDATCSQVDASFEGVCLLEDECCLIDASNNQNFTGAEVCTGIVGGEWFGDVDCETVPVELQSFDVEK